MPDSPAEAMAAPASSAAPPPARTGKPHARDVAQVRGVLAERVVLSTTLDPFLSLRALAGYSGLSVRTLRAYVDAVPDEALPCYRLPGKIVVRRSEFDAWLERFRTRGRPSLVRALRELGLESR
jgi:Helix-turn-helix domain